MTTIRIPPVLRDATGGKRQVEATGADVRELLENLATSYPQLRERILADGELAPFVNLYIEGEDVRTRDGLDTEVDDDDQLILLPAMAGGG
jgi:molybdopterin converting factor small subunit